MLKVTRDELLSLLRQGADAFNAWREINLEADLDLAGVTLKGMALDGALLAGAKLDGAEFARASLRRAVFSGASLAGASFFEADLRGAAFGPPELVKAELALSPLGARLLAGAELAGASFVRARLEGASFRECTLAGVDLRGCDLSAVDLRKASLDGALVDGDSGGQGGAGWEALTAQPERVRRSIMQSLLLLGAADGRFAPEEQVFLTAVADEFGFDQAAIDELMPRGHIVLEAFAVEAPEAGEAKGAWLDVMAQFVGIEGTISPAELNVFGHVGEKLGFSDREMSERLSQQLGIEVSPAG